MMLFNIGDAEMTVGELTLELWPEVGDGLTG